MDYWLTLKASCWWSHCTKGFLITLEQPCVVIGGLGEGDEQVLSEVLFLVPDSRLVV
jgi:hypothetical protein